jgi:polyphosphate kinase 2 (PPK2 family)
MSKKDKEKKEKKILDEVPVARSKKSDKAKAQLEAKGKPAAASDGVEKCIQVDKEAYEKELRRLQVELIKLQEWVRFKGLKVVVIFEGRDAAGKGGVIKRITESLNPRVCRVVALPAPTEREKTQWYFQRYAAHRR